MPERILIADDEEMICSILSQRLSQEGYFYVTANHGRETLHHTFGNIH
jgi:DNA-binding NtrC family response regulator